MAGFGQMEGLHMYADDGLALSREHIDIHKVMKQRNVTQMGLQLADDKPFGEQRKFKFLGIEYDLERRIVKGKKKLQGLGKQ